MGTKLSHFGMSGHLAVMSELLRLGYNVAIPYVDVGEDIYVINDNAGGALIAHVQVKASTAEVDGTVTRGQYGNIRKDHLRGTRAVRLIYVFALLDKNQLWDFIVMTRDELRKIRDEYDQRKPPKPPNPSTAESEPEGKESAAYGMQIQYTTGDATLWGISLQKYRGRDKFETYFERVDTGAGAKETKKDPTSPPKV